MESTRRQERVFQSNTEGFASLISPAPQTARFFRLTFPDGQPRLTIGPGDHTSQTWLLSREQVILLVKDALPEVLGR